MRLRTLPLALASIGMGSFLAAASGKFSWLVLALCGLTTILLQVLSNFANDYGDSVHGADHVERAGPSREVQSGSISMQSMKRAIVLLAILSLISGILLLKVAATSNFEFWIFLGLGVLSIIAAITYTAGSRPYGYAGLGDISVFIFFGWVGVLGTYFLHTNILDWNILLPASTCSFFSVAVMNINNIRDMESDAKAGKISIPVRLGRKRAIGYHWFLLVAGLACALIYTIIEYQHPAQFLFLLLSPFLFRNGLAVQSRTESMELDPYLKQMALTTLLFVIVFGIGMFL